MIFLWINARLLCLVILQILCFVLILKFLFVPLSKKWFERKLMKLWFKWFFKKKNWFVHSASSEQIYECNWQDNMIKSSWTFFDAWYICTIFIRWYSRFFVMYCNSWILDIYLCCLFFIFFSLGCHRMLT